MKIYLIKENSEGTFFCEGNTLAQYPRICLAKTRVFCSIGEGTILSKNKNNNNKIGKISNIRYSVNLL